MEHVSVTSSGDYLLILSSNKISGFPQVFGKNENMDQA